MTAHRDQDGATAPRPARRARLWWWAGLALCLLVAGVLSRFASQAPDGLERVAEDAQLGPGLERSAALEYSGVGGLIGTLVVLTFAGALVWAVRRRGR